MPLLRVIQKTYKLQFVCLIGGLIAVYRTKFQYVFRTFDLSFMFHFFCYKVIEYQSFRKMKHPTVMFHF